MKTQSLILSLAGVLAAAPALAQSAEPAAPAAPAAPTAPAPASMDVPAPATPAEPATSPEPETIQIDDDVVTSSYVGITESEATDGDDFTVGIAPRVGLAIPTSKLGLWASFGIAVDYPLSFVDGLVVSADYSFTRPSHDGTVMDARLAGDATFDIDESEYKFALDAIYRHGLSEKLVVLGGAGPVIQILHTVETTSLAPGDNTATETKFGFELLGGVDYRIGPGFLLGELRAVYTDLDDMLTGDSNAGNITFSAGYRVLL